MLATSEPMKTESAGATRSTIVLLDDDVTTLLVLHTILEQTDAYVVECEDEPCAVRCCQERLRRVDLLVADVVLQGSNGPAVARKVRPSQPLMRLLFISGFSLQELHRRGLLSPDEIAEGSAEFLQKPFSPEEFTRRVAKLLAN
jgi:response regulator RpfG family c-di-GMP phosphodiesterase